MARFFVITLCLIALLNPAVVEGRRRRRRDVYDIDPPTDSGHSAVEDRDGSHEFSLPREEEHNEMDEEEIVKEDDHEPELDERGVDDEDFGRHFDEEHEDQSDEKEDEDDDQLPVDSWDSRGQYGRDSWDIDWKRFKKINGR